MAAGFVKSAIFSTHFNKFLFSLNGVFEKAGFEKAELADAFELDPLPFDPDLVDAGTVFAGVVVFVAIRVRLPPRVQPHHALTSHSTNARSVADSHPATPPAMLHWGS